MSHTAACVAYWRKRRKQSSEQEEEEAEEQQPPLSTSPNGPADSEKPTLRSRESGTTRESPSQSCSRAVFCAFSIENDSHWLTRASVLQKSEKCRKGVRCGKSFTDSYGGALSCCVTRHRGNLTSRCPVVQAPSCAESPAQAGSADMLPKVETESLGLSRSYGEQRHVPRNIHGKKLLDL